MNYYDLTRLTASCIMMTDPVLQHNVLFKFLFACSLFNDTFAVAQSM
jgi:hypothetical protein